MDKEKIPKSKKAENFLNDRNINASYV